MDDVGVTDQYVKKCMKIQEIQEFELTIHNISEFKYLIKIMAKLSELQEDELEQDLMDLDEIIESIQDPEELKILEQRKIGIQKKLGRFKYLHS